MIADQLIEAFDNQDGAAFEAALNELGSSLPQLAPEEVAANAARIAPELERLPAGLGSYVAQLLGGMFMFGADPAIVVTALVDSALRILESVTLFKSVVDQSGLELPGERTDETFAATMQALLSLPSLDLSQQQAGYFTECWFAADGWIGPLVALAQRREVRAAIPRKAELTAAVKAAKEDVGAANWLYGLLQVLDDEQFLVLHRAGGQAWRCTMSGIGDNFQLETLISAQLAERLGATPPRPDEIEAATTGELKPSAPMQAVFQITDALGGRIWREGRPADVPSVDGVRVVVLDPMPYNHTWNVGRLYPDMVPSLTVDAELTAAEAAQWAEKIKPAAD